MNQALLLLLVGVPPTPSSLRVRVWRRLRSLGAVALKRSAYLLPDTPERYEDFQWLAQEVQREGGDATLTRAIGGCAISALAIWCAAPRKVRAVSGR